MKENVGVGRKLGCTSGEGWWPIEDFYLDDEYGYKMSILEQEMLDGDDRD